MGLQVLPPAAPLLGLCGSLRAAEWAPKPGMGLKAALSVLSGVKPMQAVTLYFLMPLYLEVYCFTRICFPFFRNMVL